MAPHDDQNANLDVDYVISYRFADTGMHRYTLSFWDSADAKDHDRQSRSKKFI